jgi:hypothetical protein
VATRLVAEDEFIVFVTCGVALVATLVVRDLHRTGVVLSVIVFFVVIVSSVIGRLVVVVPPVVVILLAMIVLLIVILPVVIVPLEVDRLVVVVPPVMVIFLAMIVLIVILLVVIVPPVMIIRLVVIPFSVVLHPVIALPDIFIHELNWHIVAHVNLPLDDRRGPRDEEPAYEQVDRFPPLPPHKRGAMEEAKLRKI